MADTENDNPLFCPQREKSGAETYKHYTYQYNWALYRIISKHKEQREYAVFVELHEDVVIADSLNSQRATFEFNQIKTSKTPFTTYQLIHHKKGGNSVLGKLIKGGSEEFYKDKISSLNIVSLNEFNLELKGKGIELDKIGLNDLSKNQLNELKEAIKDELGSDSLPSNIQFIVSDLPLEKSQNVIIGDIANLISDISPNSYCNAGEIYRLLFDEINKKGTVTWDFKTWEDLLSKKALTSVTVTKVINQFTKMPEEDRINEQVEQLCTELNLSLIEKKKFKRNVDRYHYQRTGNNNTIQNNITNEITSLITKSINNNEENVRNLIDNVYSSLSDKTKKIFPTVEEVKSAIAYEFIIMP